MNFISAAELYTINEEVTGQRPRVRDRHLLRSAANRPFTFMFGQEIYPSVLDKAAALLHSLAYHHLFVDGNKRTATRAIVLFLERSGYRVTWTPQEAYDFVLEVAKGQLDVPEIAARLEAFTAPAE
ncbi:MAG: type II toxin-antitoxin system death-on-curing family toxin [Phototrophicaceae bacterium]